MGAPLLELTGLTTSFRARGGRMHAVEDISFAIGRGRVLGIVGESGSGKSVTALSIMGLLPQPIARVERGSIRFEGRELTGMPEREMQSLRGSAIAMVFQEPMTSLNPVFRVGDQVAETVTLHRAGNRRAARARAIELLRLVGIPDPERRARDYPHQLSGGMRQRVMIAIALACEPRLLVADEPTTALDVTIQAQILELLARLRRELGIAMMLITHDLGVIAGQADDVVVMYAGRIVERARVDTLFRAPGHPYTAALLASMPRLDERMRRLRQIGGSVPGLAALPAGCRFHPRCPEAQAICRARIPPEFPLADGQAAACWKHNGFQPA